MIFREDRCLDMWSGTAYKRLALKMGRGKILNTSAEFIFQ